MDLIWRTIIMNWAERLCRKCTATKCLGLKAVGLRTLRKKFNMLI